MNIKNHLLFQDNDRQCAYVATPNRGGKYTPQYLTMHYTAATSASSTINWFKNPQARASAHLLIDRGGNVTQFAPFNVIAWHAGVSQWGGVVGLNAHSIGIELVNGGRLTKVGEGFICPVDQRSVAASEVINARHKNESQNAYWHQYTEPQLTAALDIAALLVQHYRLKDVLGHEDISPIRKSDPGPAFPMASFRSRAMGRQNERLDLYHTTANVNVRSGAGTSFAQVMPFSLPKGTKVLELKREGNWSFVEVLDVVEDLNDLEGWVSTKYLEQS